MILEARIYEAVGYQDDGASAPVTFLEVTLNAIVNGEAKSLTIGRIFWTDPEVIDAFVGEPPYSLTVNDEREVRVNE